MDKQEIRSKIRDIVCEVLSISPDYELFEEESNLFDQFGATTVDIVHIVEDIEEEFNIMISDSDLNNIKTTKDLNKIVIDSMIFEGNKY